MVRNHRVARALHDAALAEIRRQLADNPKWRGDDKRAVANPDR
jgi:hypothetical protein